MGYEYRKIWCNEGKGKYLVGIYLESTRKTYQHTLNDRLKNTKGCYVTKY